jgi:hypothetical protein
MDFERKYVEFITSNKLTILEKSLDIQPYKLLLYYLLIFYTVLIKTIKSQERAEGLRRHDDLVAVKPSNNITLTCFHLSV